MKLLLVGSEALPFVSTGGLGDVLGSLPVSLAASDPTADVRVALPLYGQIAPAWREQMTFVCSLTVPLGWRQQYCGIFSLVRSKVTWYFLDNEYYFRRGTVYGAFDEAERYAFFCRAVLEMLPHIGFFPDILHAHDWQAGLTLVYLQTLFSFFPYSAIRRVFTIHNIEYQGQFDPRILGDVLGLPEDTLPLLRHDGCLNLMKAAVECAGRITTVSPRYADELRSGICARGLHPILAGADSAGKLTGILNGIDTDYYDPAADPAIAFPFSYLHPEGKQKSKKALQKELGLPGTDAPLLAVVSRLVEQKGIDLMTGSFYPLLSGNDLQLAVLGRGEERYEAWFRNLAAAFPRQVRFSSAFDRDLAKRIYAGCDLFLMPSRTEPCGLAQMIALRYGAIPVVRETGGLFDSVRYYQRLADGTIVGNGFTFADYTPIAFSNCILAALALWRDESAREALIRHNLQADFSWHTAAEKYRKVYRECL